MSLMQWWVADLSERCLNGIDDEVVVVGDGGLDVGWRKKWK